MVYRSIFFSALIFASAPYALSATSVQQVTQAYAPYLSAIRSEAEFLQYSNQIDTNRFTKFVIDLHTNEIYYFDVNKYEVHADFVHNELLKKPLTIRQQFDFNKNYDEVKPHYLLGYIVHHLHPNIWTFAFWEGDKASVAHTTQAYKQLQETFFLAEKIKFQPNSTYQETMALSLVDIPVVTNDVLYRLNDYQPFHVGEAVGILRIVKKSMQPDELQFAKNEIVILSELLPDITPVAGIITEQFSTPLSHLALRARAWGIPNIGLQDAIEKYEFLDGEFVYLNATRSGFELRKATDAEVEMASHKPNTVPSVRVSRVDLHQRQITLLNDLRKSSAPAFGTKAANLGEITQFVNRSVSVPAGFAIPVCFYAEHLMQSGASSQIDEFLQLQKGSVAVGKVKLQSIREAILDFPVDECLLEEAWKRVQLLKTTADEGVFVRSSTNAEDLHGFNGAGLYDTVANVVNKTQLEQAIKTVWASVWNLKAFQEREFFSIDHNSVYSALLVQKGVNASAAGVLITKDIFDPNETMEVYTINAKRGLGVAVVDGTTIPEQILFNYDNRGIKVLSRSSDESIVVFDEQGGIKKVPNPYAGRAVLTDAEATQLAEAAHRIKALFKENQASDIEWLFADQKLYIVQVRPYVEN